MSELNKKDVDILKFYAANGNRELYWNYLAQHPGNDGYGLLALGVVRNDNAPGATANVYAANYARSRDGKILSEREWNDFGKSLLNEDFELRLAHYESGRFSQALNLPVMDVKRAHDESFRAAHINPNAWTPRELLEAAQRHGGDAEAEKVWDGMLNDAALGVGRIATPLEVAKYDDDKIDSWAYVGRMTMARAEAAVSRSSADPDTVGAVNYYHHYDERSRQWTTVNTAAEGLGAIRPVTDPKLIAELEDTRALRLERKEQQTQFHPLDSNRERGIMKSPWLISDADGTAPTQGSAEARLAASPSSDPTQPGHPDHALYRQCLAGVHRLDASLGRAPDESGLRMAANLTRVAKENGLTQVDHVVLSVKTDYVKQGENVFVVQGAINDPAHLRAHTGTALATTTPPDKAFARMAELEQTRAQEPSRAHVAGAQQQATEPETPRQRV